MFIPLPRCKPIPGHEKNLTDALADQAASAITLATKTRSLAPDDAAFQSYMFILDVMGNGRLVSEWGNPFNSGEVMKSTEAKVEYAATVWNYISWYQGKFAAIDPRKEVDLRSGSGFLSKLNALTEIYRNIVRDMTHPFFTTETADFLRDYHAYITSLFQLAICESGKTALRIQVKTSLRCLEQAKLADRSNTSCSNDCRTYFRGMLELVKKYFNAYTYLRHGMQLIQENQHGQAIACLRYGEGLIGATSSDKCFAAHIVTSLSMLQANLKSLCQQELRENTSVYHQLVPDTIQIPDAPLLLHEIKPDAELISKFRKGGVAVAGYDQLDTMVSQSLSATVSHPVFTTSSPVPPVFTPGVKPVSSSPQVTPPRTPSATYIAPPEPMSPQMAVPTVTPAFTSSQGDGALLGAAGYPAMANGGFDMPYGQGFDMDNIATVDVVPMPCPTSMTQTNPYAEVITASTAVNVGEQFPLWPIAQSMKTGVLEKIETMKGMYPHKMSSILVYENLVKQASEVDAKIQAYINGWGDQGLTAEMINEALESALRFYNSVELKLDEIA